jgi:hypothetical protein
MELPAVEQSAASLVLERSQVTLDYVDSALEAWAKWGKGGIETDWPAITLLGKIADQQLTGASQRGPIPEMGLMVFVVEKAVLRLKPVERRVVIKHYVYWQPVECSAKYCHMSPNRFRAVLNRAKNLIGEWISQPFARTSKPQ